MTQGNFRRIPTSVISSSWKKRLAARGHKTNVLLITSKTLERIYNIQSFLSGECGVDNLCVFSNVASHPDIKNICELTEVFGSSGIEEIIAIGGGSVIDTAKVLAVFLGLGVSTSVEDYIKKSLPLHGWRSIELIVIPTTAGTGSEVTPFATVWNRNKCSKYSLSSEQCYPDEVILDPSLIASVPQGIGVIASLDTISHSLESIWNRNADEETIRIATESLFLSLNNLALSTYTDSKLDSLHNLQLASAYAGVAISKTKTALAHSMSYPLTSKYGIPHGVACSFTLPALLAFNAHVDDGRLLTLSRNMGFRSIDELRIRLKSLLTSLGIQDLASCSTLNTPNKFLDLAQHMLHKGRAENNMRDADVEDVKQILKDSIPLLGIHASQCDH